MSKSVLVIDTPQCCDECPLRYYEEAYMCCVLNEDVEWIYDRAERCPLKPMPQKCDGTVELTDTSVSNTFKSGWNACLKEITGETE